MAQPDPDMLDMIIWNKTEASWYGVPAGKFTRRQVLQMKNDRLAEARKKQEAEQG
jgi:hypothetical protein